MRCKSFFILQGVFTDKTVFIQRKNRMNEPKEKFINIRPLCVAAVCFAVGIFSAYSLFSGDFVFLTAVVCFFVALIIYFFVAKSNKKAICLMLIAALVFVGGFVYARVLMNKALSASEYSGVCTFKGTVEESYYVENKGYYITFCDIEINGIKQNCKAGGLLYFSKLDGFSDGQKVFVETFKVLSFECKITLAENSENAYDFFGGNYYNLLSINQVGDCGISSNVFKRISYYLKNLFKNNLTADCYPVAIALFTGDTSYLSKQSINVYRMAGIAHVFAVSGLHIGLFASLFSFIAEKIKAKRLLKFVCVMLPVIFYCGLCGFGPSSVRAAIMVGVGLIAEIMGFKKDKLSVLAIAFWLVLLINPFYLFDKGCQLSFLAVCGIFVLQPILKNGAKPLKSLGDGICLSLSATLATLPILTDMSGYISVISLFANLIFVPAISLIYKVSVVFSLFAVVENLLFASCKVSLFLPDALLSLLTAAVQACDFSLFTFPSQFSFFTLTYYLGLICLSNLLNLSAKQKTLICGFAALITVVGMIFFV